MASCATSGAERAGWTERLPGPDRRPGAAGRDRVAGIPRVTPEAWGHTVRSSGQGEVSVRQMIKKLMPHAPEHMEEIPENRRVHGLKEVHVGGRRGPPRPSPSEGALTARSAAPDRGR